MKRLVILTILLLAMVGTTSAGTHQDAIDTAAQTVADYADKLPYSVTFTTDQLAKAGYDVTNMSRPGTYSVTIKDMSYNATTGTLDTFINAWHDGNSIHIHNPIHWYMPFPDGFVGVNGAARMKQYEFLVLSYLDTKEYGEPANDDTSIFYPIVEGQIYQSSPSGSTWDIMRSGSGSYVYESGTLTSKRRPYLDESLNPTLLYNYMGRGVYSFNTGSLENAATITSSNFSLYFTGSKQTSAGTAFAVGITGGNLASNTSLVAGDYDGFQNTRLIIDKSYDNFTSSGRYMLPLNSNGLSYISKTSYTVLFMRDSPDIDNSNATLTWDGDNQAFLSVYDDASDPQYRVYLEIIWTPSSTPTPTFTTDVTSGTTPTSVSFTDTSEGATSWSWIYRNIIGNNLNTTFSTSQNPNYIFPIGNFSITLNGCNSLGCTDSAQTTFINVSADTSGGSSCELIYPAIDGYATDTTASTTYEALRARGGTATASGSTTTVNAPLLDTGANTASAFHIFNRGILSFNTATIPENAVGMTANLSLYVTAKENELGSPAYGITGGTLASNTSIAAGDFDGFQDVRYATDIAYASIGTSARNVWVLNDAGLANVSTSSYTVVYLRDSWDIDNSGPAFAKSSTTSITWNPVGYTGTANDPYLDICYQTPPVAAFFANATAGAGSLPVQFSDISTGGATNWDWYWSADEVKDSDEQSPETTFTPGTYDIRLYVSNGVGGDWENKTGYIEVTGAAAPVAAFSADETSGEDPLSVTFTDASTNDPDDWDWYWYANETKSSDTQSPSTSFTEGTYSVRLWAANGEGGDWENKTDYITVTAPAGDPPVASFTTSKTFVRIPQSITFTDTSTETPTSWLWDFGDGTTSTDQSPVHKYTKRGKWDVTLTATNDDGSDTSDITPIGVTGYDTLT